ncbi:MAG: aminopeptidase [Clostridiales bacterium]|jgi:aspartyl aminopeptidase|nr:aminopeptidase [Clostridiales bacterium]
MFSQNESVYKKANRQDILQAYSFCEEYKKFLTACKTEREAIAYSITMAEQNGFVKYDEYAKYNPGDKVYFVNRGKNIMLAVIGKNILDGVNLVIAHVDSPRLDLKQNPLYQECDIAYLKTHYYGGIKKYQWTAIPLSLHGVVVTSSGVIDVVIGEKSGEPVFTITDLLPHLSSKQMAKKLDEAIEGEALNILFGTEMDANAEKDEVKNNILSLLSSKYGFEEEDFISAELTAVPQFGASDVGLDASLIGSYGQDDRVCAYTALEAIVKVDNPERTAIVVLADKEEVGSMGATGAKSAFWVNCLANLINKMVDNYSDILLRNTLSNSKCLSADVGAALDPIYKEAQEKNNAPQVNHGVIITKYTGSRGKSGSSDATAEFVGEIRQLFNENNVAFQIGELGKVDGGGGGTVAQFIANLNIDTVDCGVPILSMHSPFEVASKMDVWAAYCGYCAFMGAQV